ncbi:hypothetical protein [Salipiger mangrovisoli]|uniref:Uncharacterized protein n=1 Tax=Salipiger mangrovisoli TaxID=2865933 RepID=A0ABR9XA14_9RHOB|nr:hypothetical protein [Salipiger mangrovisoli]MBE9640358.1 hypothetical protein [Salipiger mangrovisoli]
MSRSSFSRVHSDGKPARLSGAAATGGALARAPVSDPSVRMMEGPMGALDVRLKEERQLDVRRFQREIGATGIYVTRAQNGAMPMSDLVALMRDGQIEQQDPDQKLYQ